MSTPRPSLAGIGLSAPDPVDQSDLADLAITLTGAGSADRIRRLYRSVRIDSRGALLAQTEAARNLYRHAPGTRGPTTAQRMTFYDEAAPALARAAATGALRDAHVQARDITHLVTVSCTGFAAPGIEHGLIRRLGLPPDVERTHIGFMGCHGSLNAIRVARAIAKSDPSERILIVAVEICSAHFSYDDSDEKRIANALFADGAGAAVIGHGPGLPILATGSRIIPGSETDMRWRIGDHGFEMTLSRRVPALIREHLRPWAEAWLARRGLSVGDVRHWAVHPGGPKILDAAVDALGLEPGAAEPSRRVLRTRGNMSSPTILFVLDRLRREAAGPIAALAFGPGLTVEAALFEPAVPG